MGNPNVAVNIVLAKLHLQNLKIFDVNMVVIAAVLFLNKNVMKKNFHRLQNLNLDKVHAVDVKILVEILRNIIGILGVNINRENRTFKVENGIVFVFFKL